MQKALPKKNKTTTKTSESEDLSTSHNNTTVTLFHCSFTALWKPSWFVQHDIYHTGKEEEGVLPPVAEFGWICPVKTSLWKTHRGKNQNSVKLVSQPSCSTECDALCCSTDRASDQQTVSGQWGWSSWYWHQGAGWVLGHCSTLHPAPCTVSDDISFKMGQ